MDHPAFSGTTAPHSPHTAKSTLHLTRSQTTSGDSGIYCIPAPFSREHAGHVAFIKKTFSLALFKGRFLPCFRFPRQSYDAPTLFRKESTKGDHELETAVSQKQKKKRFSFLSMGVSISKHSIHFPALFRVYIYIYTKSRGLHCASLWGQCARMEDWMRNRAGMSSTT